MNKDPDIVSKSENIIILDIKSDVCMANQCKDTEHTRHVYRRVHFVINGDNCKMQKI